MVGALNKSAPLHRAVHRRAVQATGVPVRRNFVHSGSLRRILDVIRTGILRSGHPEAHCPRRPFRRRPARQGTLRVESKRPQKSAGSRGHTWRTDSFSQPGPSQESSLPPACAGIRRSAPVWPSAGLRTRCLAQATARGRKKVLVRSSSSTSACVRSPCLSPAPSLRVRMKRSSGFRLRNGCVFVSEWGRPLLQ